jgi:hypothetical protein
LLAGRPPGQPAGNPMVPPKSQLVCLNIHFQGSITGNLRSQQLSFHNEVRAIYEPVTDWSAMLDPTKPEKMGPEGILLNSDDLDITQMPMPDGVNKAIEMKAYGNVVVDGKNFTARADRISYDMGKDMLILEGGGRNNAELFKQNQPGAPRSSYKAKKIQLWPKTMRLKIDGARSLEINDGK